MSSIPKEAFEKWVELYQEAKNHPPVAGTEILVDGPDTHFEYKEDQDLLSVFIDIRTDTIINKETGELVDPKGCWRLIRSSDQVKKGLRVILTGVEKSVFLQFVFQTENPQINVVGIKITSMSKTGKSALGELMLG